MARNQGTAHGMAKLTDRDVAEVRALKGIIPQRELAKRMRISQTQVQRIQKGERWSHLHKENSNG